MTADSRRPARKGLLMRTLIATLAAARFYSEILTEIERFECDVFRGRARVSTARKLRQTPRVAAAFLRSAFNPSAYGRAS